MTRLHRDVALSLWQLNVIPARSEKGLKYLLEPDDPNMLLLQDWTNLDNYQLYYWYCLEVARHAEMYKELFQLQGAKVVSITLGQLTTLEEFQNLVHLLQLPTMPWLDKIKTRLFPSIKVNGKENSKSYKETPGNLDELERQVLDLVG